MNQTDDCVSCNQLHHSSPTPRCMQYNNDHSKKKKKRFKKCKLSVQLDNDEWLDYDGWYTIANRPFPILWQYLIHFIKNNVHNSMAKTNKSRIESTLKNYNNYKIHKNLVLYLQKTGNSYQGKI